MSASFKAIFGLVLLQICAFRASGQGTVIANDAALVPYFGSSQTLTLTNSVNPSEGRYGRFAITITPQGNSQFMFSYDGIAEEYALYSVAFGATIDPVFATSTTPVVSNNGVDPGSSLQTFFIGQSRYFGYWDDRPLGGNGTPDMNDNYGWVLIERTASELQVLSSATALGGGVIAGTFTSVPEPSAKVLTLLGVGLCLFVRRVGFRFRASPNATNIVY